jgi:transposase
MQADALLADKAFDADKRVIEPLLNAGKTPVIPSMPGRKNPRPYDRHLFAARHLVENFFCKLKQFRAIATPLRQTCYKLPRRHLCCLYPHLAQLRTGLTPTERSDE